MRLKVLAVAGLAASLAATASPEVTSDLASQRSEALAWTIAAFASCDSVETLQRDIRHEAVSLSANPDEVMEALKILAETDQVCGLLNEYAADMVVLSSINFTQFQARLTANEDPPAPFFETMQPEGAGEAYDSVILDASRNSPPLSGAGVSPPAPSASPDPTPPPPSGESDPGSSDYQ